MRILACLICAFALVSCGANTKSNDVASSASPTNATTTPSTSTSVPASETSTKISSEPSTRTEILSDPTARNLADIASHWLGQPIDIEQEVEANSKYLSSNQFDRPKIKAQLIQSTQARIAAVENVGAIDFNININSSNYDLENQVFYLEPFSPGRYFTMDNTYGEAPAPQSRVMFTNGEQFYRLPIPAEQAKEMIQFNDRPSTARVTARIDRVFASSPGFKFETFLTRVIIYDTKGKVLVDKTL
jgi:hypothetical protein